MAVSAGMEAAVLATFVLIVAAMAKPQLMAVEADRDICPEEEIAVYPYMGFCLKPASYEYDGGRYYLSPSSISLSQALAPEWDESNATYYVRVSDIGEAAIYGFTHLTREFRSGVFLNDTFIIQNLDTGRNLQWRDEDGEKFLIETDGFTQFFQFSVNTIEDTCHRGLGARCVSYNILTVGSSGEGFGAFVEDGVTYIKEKSDLLPFRLLSATSSSSSSAAV